ncbi:alpha-1,4 glucan phosphorylase L-2 isozyme, chloroplastic/amyloplastic-like isoform X2 [Camellia sinensis]|uniref:alpha-1,4 glucan phosphorylase L-2 isozyme, chloroplastic/amyloplastic-like isoform X2 n=1 Tax=Camellia sinensis TaxID=4442 RepID=UPI0010362AB6|nr:alpha-1,4 glucan phosphorylase L-2 isozyme, chloroplastic/amyloplastic-like isoform X2 [Camellia sinensis]
MAASPFSATNSISHSNSISSFVSLSQRYMNSKPLLIRPPRSCRSRKSLTVKNIASDQKRSLNDSPSEEGVIGNRDSFRPDSASVVSSIKYHAEFTPSFSPEQFELPKAFHATAESVRDMLIINWNATYDYYEKMNVKQAYYLSMEYLQGRALLNAIGNLGLSGAYAEALRKLGLNLEDVARQEPDAALGNGGLGRLASCFLDSLATLNYPAWGYGLRYKYGLFKQLITKDGQEEVAESWLEICYVLYPGDESNEGKTLRLKQQYTLCSASLQDIIARFETRLGEPVSWDTFPNKVAVQMNDTHPTLCIPELIRILMDVKGLSWKEAWEITKRTIAYTNHTVLPEALEKWSLKLLQELLPRHVEIIKMIDDELIHTIVSEYGTEDLDLLQQKLKQMKILDNVELPASIMELLVKPEENPVVDSVEENESSEEAIEPTGKEDQSEELEPLVIESKEELTFEPEPELPEIVRMANLCVVGGCAVNGVAEIHSEIVKREVFNDFFKLWPEKFQNKTNGVTPRRWISFCNPHLSKIITKWTGTEDWLINTEKLADLRKFADNEELQSEWREAKRSNKMKVVSFLKEKTGYIVNPDAMFDVQIKRIHEYKRQLLNIMGIVYRYKKMKEMSPEERKEKFVPRVCIFGGKAFATYIQAKRIVKFITDVGATVNHDPDIGDLLKVVFVPDYNVSVAEVLIPGSELSQHISTAGMEASGTSNMKFAMNGCIIIGTLDGANVEIREEVGENNFFLFGARAEEIAGLRKERSEGKFVPDPRFEEVKAFVKRSVFGPYNYEELMGSLEGNEGYGRADYFLVGKDFPSYLECQEKVDEAYRDQKRWTKMSILNTAGSYKFSSDRTIHEYARDIWMIEPVILP